MMSEYGEAIRKVMRTIHELSPENERLIDFMDEHRSERAIALCDRGCGKTELIQCAAVASAMMREPYVLVICGKTSEVEWRTKWILETIVNMNEFTGGSTDYDKDSGSIVIEYLGDGSISAPPCHIEFASIRSRMMGRIIRDHSGRRIRPTRVLIDDPIDNETQSSVALVERVIDSMRFIRAETRVASLLTVEGHIWSRWFLKSYKEIMHDLRTETLAGDR